MTIPTEITTLAFDLGDTLIAVDPRFKGAMTGWPELCAIPGIAAALSTLQGRFRLVILSNARDSHAPQVQAALARAGLDGQFEAIFTTADLGLEKPDPAYFHKVARSLGAAPQELVMIGDSYPVDIPGARRAGWRTIWYNSGLKAAPGPAPLHDAEVSHMAGLPQALEQLGLPDLLTCQAWYLQQGGVGSIWQHVEAVGLASYHLAVMLRAAGHAVDPVLAHRGGLLHDIAKISAKRTHQDHGDLGAEILAGLGQPVLAEIALRHMLFYLVDPHKGPRTWEEKIVHYADKICEGPRFVEWPERLQGLSTRYPGSVEAMRAFTPAIEALQAELAAAAGFPAEEMVSRLRAAINQ